MASGITPSASDDSEFETASHDSTSACQHHFYLEDVFMYVCSWMRAMYNVEEIDKSLWGQQVVVPICLRQVPAEFLGVVGGLQSDLVEVIPVNPTIFTLVTSVSLSQ